MALRNPETVSRLLTRLVGQCKNLKLIVKSQQPVEEYLKKIDSTLMRKRPCRAALLPAGPAWRGVVTRS